MEDAPWVDVDPSNVSEIPGDDDSYKKQLDSMKDRIIKILDNQSPIPVRL